MWRAGGRSGCAIVIGSTRRAWCSSTRPGPRPTWRRCGDLGSHRGKAIRRIIRSVGAKLFFLPKYSPDPNPIEQLFAKLKHWLRKAARRSIEAVSHTIGQILDTVTKEECTNYFANSGYEPA